jgi:hypothetical protein
MTESDDLFFQQNPFKGVPGLRAMYFRCLYEFAMRLKRRNERFAPRRAAFLRLRQRQERWSQLYASPIADSAVNVLLWTMAVVLILNVCRSYILPDAAAGPEHIEQSVKVS